MMTLVPGSAKLMLHFEGSVNVCGAIMASTATKVAVYSAAMSSLLSGCEGWTLYRLQIK